MAPDARRRRQPSTNPKTRLCESSRSGRDVFCRDMPRNYDGTGHPVFVCSSRSFYTRSFRPGFQSAVADGHGNMTRQQKPPASNPCTVSSSLVWRSQTDHHHTLSYHRQPTLLGARTRANGMAVSALPTPGAPVPPLPLLLVQQMVTAHRRDKPAATRKNTKVQFPSCAGGGQPCCDCTAAPSDHRSGRCDPLIGEHAFIAPPKR